MNFGEIYFTLFANSEKWFINSSKNSYFYCKIKDMQSNLYIYVHNYIRKIRKDKICHALTFVVV